jgi:hypothetical protein
MQPRCARAQAGSQRRIAFDQHHLRRAARRGLETQCSGTGKQV